MKITITFRHLESTESIKNHIQEKLQKLEKYLIRPIEVHVILSIEKFRQQCEITLYARNLHVTAKEVSENLYTSIDEAMHKLERQVKKHKEIIKEHKHHHSPVRILKPTDENLTTG